MNSQTSQRQNNNININNKYDLEFILELVFDKFSQGLRIIGPIFAFALTLFVLIVSHSLFFIIIPYWSTSYHYSLGLILSPIGLFLLFSILFNYFLAVLVRPGSYEDIKKSEYYTRNDPLNYNINIIDLSYVLTKNKPTNEFKIRYKSLSKNETITDDNINKEDQLITIANNNFDSSYSDLDIESKLNKIQNEHDSRIVLEEKIEQETFNNNSSENIIELFDCKYCNLPKMIRSHHCSICGYCVLKMDHHCPWINNCVGQNNHRYFVLFLTHTMIGCLYVCLLSIPIVFNSNIKKSTEFSFVAILSFVGLLILIFFNSWNWFLVYRGNTTIEYWSLKGNLNNKAVIKDFSMSNWRENIFMIFGTKNLFKAIFLPSIKKLPYSGLEWTKLAYPSFYFEKMEMYEGKDLKITSIDNQI